MTLASSGPGSHTNYLCELAQVNPLEKTNELDSLEQSASPHPTVPKLWLKEFLEFSLMTTVGTTETEERGCWPASLLSTRIISTYLVHIALLYQLSQKSGLQS